jgi:signal transduction histidine kinase
MHKLYGINLCIDEHKLNQVIRNFISNGLKFTPRGGDVIIKANVFQNDDIIQYENESIKSKSKHGIESSMISKQSLRFLRIEIVDTGAGIAKV